MNNKLHVFPHDNIIMYRCYNDVCLEETVIDRQLCALFGKAGQLRFASTVKSRDKFPERDGSES